MKLYLRYMKEYKKEYCNSISMLSVNCSVNKRPSYFNAYQP